MNDLYRAIVGDATDTDRRLASFMGAAAVFVLTGGTAFRVLGL